MSQLILIKYCTVLPMDPFGKAQNVQIHFRPGLHPGLRWASLRRLPRLPIGWRARQSDTPPILRRCLQCLGTFAAFTPHPMVNTVVTPKTSMSSIHCYARHW